MYVVVTSGGADIDMAVEAMKVAIRDLAYVAASSSGADVEMAAEAMTVAIRGVCGVTNSTLGSAFISSSSSTPAPPGLT